MCQRRTDVAYRALAAVLRPERPADERVQRHRPGRTRPNPAEGAQVGQWFRIGRLWRTTTNRGRYTQRREIAGRAPLSSIRAHATLEIAYQAELLENWGTAT
jgi:hypothetical protein